MSFFFPDVVGCPSTGTPVQNLRDIVCLAPKAADQLSVINTQRRVISGSGAALYQRYNDRFSNYPLVITISG